VLFLCYMPRSTQPGHPSVGRRNEYQRKLGRKQAHRVMHYLYPWSGSANWCLAEGGGNGDQRSPMGLMTRERNYERN